MTGRPAPARPGLRALSVRQPWVELMFADVMGADAKDIENRTWATTFRGPVLLHAAKGMTEAEFTDAMDFADAIAPLSRAEALRRRARIRLEGRRGGIVGAAEIVDCVSASDSPWFVGTYGFVLRNVRRVPFQLCRGQLGFFAPEIAADPAIAAVAAQLPPVPAPEIDLFGEARPW